MLKLKWMEIAQYMKRAQREGAVLTEFRSLAHPQTSVDPPGLCQVQFKSLPAQPESSLPLSPPQSASPGSPPLSPWPGLRAPSSQLSLTPDFHFQTFHVLSPSSASLHPAHLIEANFFFIQKNREHINSGLCLHNRALNKERQLPLSPETFISEQLSPGSKGKTGPAGGARYGQSNPRRASGAGSWLCEQSS